MGVGGGETDFEYYSSLLAALFFHLHGLHLFLITSYAFEPNFLN